MMTFYYDNLADSAVLTSISQNDNFPVQNIQNFIPSKVYETGITASGEAIYFNFGNSTTISNLIIYNHNFDGTETNFYLNGTTDPTYTSILFQTPITPIIVGEPINIAFSGVSYPYWSISFTKALANDIRSIGRVFLGSSFSFDSSGDPDYDGYTVTSTDPSVVDKSIGGQTFVEQKEQFRTFDLTFTAKPDYEKTNMDIIYSTVGTWYPIFLQVLPESDTSLAETLYVRITTNTANKVNSWNGFYSLPNWTYAMSFEEQI